MDDDARVFSFGSSEKRHRKGRERTSARVGRDHARRENRSIARVFFVVVVSEEELYLILFLIIGGMRD